MKTKAYEKELRHLQILLVRFQQAAIESGERVVVILEGRDSAGKDGTIKRIVAHLSARNTRVVALPKPNERERGQWYFQRYAEHLPTVGEIVLFNRSWYNRGGVEPVMGFCTPDEHEAFLEDAPHFERMLTEGGIKLVKFWLDISKDEQAERLDARRSEPLKALKVSPLDDEAQKRWDAYSKARDQMLTRTHKEHAPWICVRADKKKGARLAVIQHLLKTIAPKEIAAEAKAPDPEILFTFDPAAIKDGRLAP
ncbi:polyphosphate kinase 2 [Caulobacter sp. NIBR2454]|uniref:polyphosphate kinase 2 n=1 Tax=Caulobacter sp. NIBR2454 TaxID=3015996 RepID=UPI0022B6FF78|nr:polyphosphate kinase 2 [Caulobacter sp. NIBR2454]